MTDKEYDIPVKVVDRRWWARGDDGGTATAAGTSKPTYVEELERRREIGKDVERGRREILADLLDVVDNLDRAIESARQSTSPEALLQGVEMVRRQFLGKLEGFGVKRIDVTGATFDPALHEAVSTVPADAPEDDGTIVGVVRHGYTVGDEVLRPASVAVAKS